MFRISVVEWMTESVRKYVQRGSQGCTYTLREAPWQLWEKLQNNSKSKDVNQEIADTIKEKSESHLNLLRLVLWPNMSILDKIPWALEKNVCCIVVGVVFYQYLLGVFDL